MNFIEKRWNALHFVNDNPAPFGESFDLGREHGTVTQLGKIVLVEE